MKERKNKNKNESQTRSKAQIKAQIKTQKIESGDGGGSGGSGGSGGGGGRASATTSCLVFLRGLLVFLAWPSFLTLTACGGGGGGGGGISLTISSVSVSIDNPVSITGSNAHQFPLSGTCSLQDQPVTLNVGGIVPSNQPVCERGKWEIVLNVTKLLGGGRPNLSR